MEDKELRERIAETINKRVADKAIPCRVVAEAVYGFILRDRKEQKEKLLKILQRWRDDGGYLEEALKKRLEE